MPVDRWKLSLPMAIDKHDVTVADSAGNQLHLHFTPLRFSNGHLLDREWLTNFTTHRCFQFLFLKDAACHGNIFGKAQAKPVTRAPTSQNIPPEPSVSAKVGDHREVRRVWISLFQWLPVTSYLLTPSQRTFCHKIGVHHPRHRRECSAYRCNAIQL